MTVSELRREARTVDEEDVVPMQEVEHEGLVVCCHLGVGNPDEQVEGASGDLALEAIDRLDSAQAVVSSP